MTVHSGDLLCAVLNIIDGDTCMSYTYPEATDIQTGQRDNIILYESVRTKFIHPLSFSRQRLEPMNLCSDNVM